MIFFDFDGTIVNVWPRYYQVFLAASGISGVSLSQYRAAKRTAVSDLETARLLGVELPDGYFTEKRALLEDASYLRLDRLLLSPEELETFFNQFSCRILTCRRRPQAFLREMDELGLSALSDRAIVLDPDAGGGKKDFLERSFHQGLHTVVGDSEAEWEAASQENVRTVLVRTGLRSPEDFPPAERRTIVPSIREFMAVYTKRGTEPCRSKKN